MSLEHKNKYNTELCDNKMTFEECELAIIRHASDKNEKLQGEEMIRSEDIRDIIKILEEFIIRKKVICYGGIAINNILPKNAQFYNKNSDIPDYDFFSPRAMDDAKELVDLYYSRGYNEVEAKSGMHIGTYKVFVNFFAIADITMMDPELFEIMKKDAIEIAGIYYTPPDFLRMSIYLEFSRPSGDVSRWEKIFKRLKLLNKYYPFAEKTNCRDSFYLDKGGEENLFYLVRDSLIQQGVVFFGGYATSLYNHYDKKKTKKWTPHIGGKRMGEERKQGIPYMTFDVLSEDPTMTALIIKDLLEKNGYKNVKEVPCEMVGEIIPQSIEVTVGDLSVTRIFYPIACHNYNTITLGHQEINVATIDTILSFYLAFLYTKEKDAYKNKLMCMAKFLFEIQEMNRFEQKGLLKRFDMKCIGKQPTMEEIRSEKSRLFNELKGNKNAREYQLWFLRYIPKEKKEGKQLGIDIVKPGEPIDETTPPPVKKHKKNNKTKKNKNPLYQLFQQGKTVKKREKRDKRKRNDYLY